MCLFSTRLYFNTGIECAYGYCMYVWMDGVDGNRIDGSQNLSLMEDSYNYILSFFL